MRAYVGDLLEPRSNFPVDVPCQKTPQSSDLGAHAVLVSPKT